MKAIMRGSPTTIARTWPAISTMQNSFYYVEIKDSGLAIEHVDLLGVMPRHSPYACLFGTISAGYPWDCFSFSTASFEVWKIKPDKKISSDSMRTAEASKSMPDLSELAIESCYSAFRKHCMEIHGLNRDDTDAHMFLDLENWLLTLLK
jgi:hypothetical protein